VPVHRLRARPRVRYGRYGAAHQPDGLPHGSTAATPIPGEPDTELAGASAVASRSWCPASFSPLAVALVTSPPRPRRPPWLGRAPACTPSSCPRAACHGLVAPERAPSAPRAIGARRAPASDTAHGRQRCDAVVSSVRIRVAAALSCGRPSGRCAALHPQAALTQARAAAEHALGPATEPGSPGLGAPGCARSFRPE
jgi:hypothetical protein